MIWGENPLFSETSIYIYIYIYYLRSSLGLELRSSFLSRQTLSFTYVTPINLGPRSPLRWFLRFLTKTTRGLLNYILFIMYVYLFIYSIIYYSLITDHLIELNLIPQVTPSCTSYCSYCFSSDLLNGIQVQFYVFPKPQPNSGPIGERCINKTFQDAFASCGLSFQPRLQWPSSLWGSPYSSYLFMVCCNISWCCCHALGKIENKS